jgi:integrase
MGCLIVSVHGRSYLAQSGDRFHCSQWISHTFKIPHRIDVLRDYRKAQLELRVRLGAGKLHGNDLLFADLEGAPLSPNAVSGAWSDYAKQIGIPEVTFHALRHTHASQLIDQGVDIVTISRRLGHGKPDITLRIYGHLFQKDDSKAAAAINSILK